MKYSSALQRLLDVLEKSKIIGSNTNKGNGLSSKVILEVMGLESSPSNCYEFYELVSNAIKEAKKIDKISEKGMYADLIDDIAKTFIEEFYSQTTWYGLKEIIQNKRIDLSLDFLVTLYDQQFPGLPYLEEESLNKIKDSFKGILDDIKVSSLSKDLKAFLIDRTKDLLDALDKYPKSGSEGLKRVTQEIIGNLIINEPRMEPENQKNTAYQRFKAAIGWLHSGLRSPALALGIGVFSAIPVTEDYYYRKYREWFAIDNERRIESMVVENNLSFQESLQESDKLFEAYKQHVLEGKEEPKALLPGKSTEEE